MKEEKQFQTESKELLNLMINSIYSNKEVFLREIISNASDAIDKYKFLALKSEGKVPSKDYKIVIQRDKKERWISILDNGIGMDKDDLENNLGTIAKSGSKEFLEKFKEVKDSKDCDLIGQFGVGFYASFMVAKKVEVLTKKSGLTGYLFTSDGNDTYSIEDKDFDVDSGTLIKLYLKDDEGEEKYSDFLEDYRIEELVTKYSDYIRYPIMMEEEISVPVKDKDGKDDPKKTETKKEIKTLNSMVPIWKKAKKDVTDKDLNEFYKNKFSDYEDPLVSIYIKAEGLLEYDALVFIPSHAPYNLYSENYEKGLALYAKGIFIQDKCKELVPDYLKFIKGLVDSEDFSLNISREMLQKSPVLNKMSSNIENKVISKLKEIETSDFDKYQKFFKAYGDHIKFGIYSSYGTKKDLLQDLLLFTSLNNPTPITLKQYKEKMVKDQKFIYFASGKTIDSIKMLPELEKYKKNGTDVLFLSESIDEFAITMMHDYDKVEFKNITADTQDDLNKEEKEKIDNLKNENKRILDDLTESLKGKVDEVAFSNKLVDAPCCISTKNGMSLNMEDVISNQPGAKDNPDAPKASKVLEINPEHSLFKAIKELTDDEDIKKYGALLYDEAILLEGFELTDKAGFVKNLNDLMLRSLKK